VTSRRRQMFVSADSILPSTLLAIRKLEKRSRHQVIPRRPRFPFTPLSFWAGLSCFWQPTLF